METLNYRVAAMILRSYELIAIKSNVLDLRFVSEKNETDYFINVYYSGMFVSFIEVKGKTLRLLKEEYNIL